MALVGGEGHVVRMRLERPADYASFGQAEAGVEVTPDVTRLALGIVNAYLVGEAGGPWVLVDAGTPGNAEKIRAEAQQLFGAEARPEAILIFGTCVKEGEGKFDLLRQRVQYASAV